MDILSLILISFAATADSFIVGLGYGVKKVHILGTSNLFISVCCLLGTSLAMLIGKCLGSWIPTGLAEMLGGLVLLCFGLYMLYSAIMPPKEGIRKFTNDPQAVDKDHSNKIELRESLMIGLVLSLNNMGLGIGAGISGYPIMITAVICAVASFLFVQAGSKCGNRITSDSHGKRLEIFSSILVILLGIRGFF